MAKEKIVLTKEGYENLQKEYRHLIDVERPAVIEALQNARAMGDLSENADYDAARNKQAEVEGRIKEIEYTLHNAKVVEVKKNDKVASIGKTVVFEKVANGDVVTVAIVSSEEADVLSDDVLKVSNQSIIGIALTGRSVGDVVTIPAVKTYDVKIIDVKVTGE